MSTNNELVPVSGASSPAFPQSGQLDWVSLSRLPVTYTLEVAARLSKAGVETGTVMFGSTLGSMFSFPPEGQRELISSLSGLKGQTSYSKALWFGFGIQHVVRDLSNTEGGATCVAICAALCIIYTPFQSAQVWRSLCQITNAPSTLRPSVHQWTSLMEVCSGSLAKSKFLLHYRFFGGLLSPQGHRPTAPAQADAVAEALHNLALLSRGSLVSATFEGSSNECAWLATVAFYLFKLSIEIQDEDEHVIHVSSVNSARNNPQAMFRREKPQGSPTALQRPLIGRTCYIGSGENLIRKDAGSIARATQAASSWTTVFEDTFSVWPDLHAEPLHSSVLKVIVNFYKLSKGSTAPKLNSSKVPWRCSDLIRAVSRTYSITGNQLLEAAKRLLPSLKIPLDIQPPTEDGREHCVQEFYSGWQKLQEACKCGDCASIRLENLAEYRGDEYHHTICLRSLVMTAIRYLLIFSPVVVDSIIGPSTTALWSLYCDSGSYNFSVSFPDDPLAQVSLMLSGRRFEERISTGACALSAGGLCIYLALLEKPDLPPSHALTIKVIPGHIRHENQSFKLVQDFGLRYDIDDDAAPVFQQIPVSRQKALCRVRATDLTLILRDHERSTIIEAQYIASSLVSQTERFAAALTYSSLAHLRWNYPYGDSLCQIPCLKPHDQQGLWAGIKLDDPSWTKIEFCPSTADNEWLLLCWMNFSEVYSRDSAEASKVMEFNLYDISSTALFTMLGNTENRFDLQELLLLHKNNHCLPGLLQLTLFDAMLLEEFEEEEHYLPPVNRGVLRLRHYCENCGWKETSTTFTVTLPALKHKVKKLLRTMLRGRFR